jgi:hypothetical protein
LLQTLSMSRRHGLLSALLRKIDVLPSTRRDEIMNARSASKLHPNRTALDLAVQSEVCQAQIEARPQTACVHHSSMMLETHLRQRRPRSPEVQATMKTAPHSYV